MSNTEAIQKLLAKRRDRAIATMLGIKERECDQHLPPEARSKLRKVILDQTNEMYELCLDVLRSFDNEGVVLNEAYLDKLDEVHAGMAVLLERT